jgi:DNA-binding GntR family transcriptional regulator
MSATEDSVTETINKQSLEAQAADLLRRQILRGELRAGERLNREVDAREICESHRELVDSICAGDAERAEKLARANIVPPEQIHRRGA